MKEYTLQKLIICDNPEARALKMLEVAFKALVP